MNSNKLFSLLFLISIVLLTACGNSKLPDDSLKQVPKDVSSITAFNLNQLMQKADYDYIKELDFFQNGISELRMDEPAMAAIMEDPFASGVDLTKNAYFVMDVDANDPSNKQFGALVFSIKDSKTFRSMLSDISMKDITNHEGYNKLSFDRDGLIAWNEDFGIIAGATSNMDIDNYLNNYFDKDRKTSVADNNDLVKCLSKNYDIATWISSDKLSTNPSLKTAANFMGISSEALSGNHFHSYFNFEEGAIVGTSDHYLKKELTNDLKLFFKNGVKTDLSKYIPAENLGFAFSAALDAKGIYQIINEKAGGITTVNAGLKKYGFTSKDVAEAFGGDMVVAVYDNPQNRKEPTGLMTATIGDQKLFKQFIDLGVQFELLTMEGENLYRVKKGLDDIRNFYLLIQDDVFFVTNGSTLLETLEGGSFATTDRIDNDLYDALTDNAFGGLVDFNFLKSIEKDFMNFPFEKGTFNAGLESSEMRLDMKNKKTNSLKA
ncbi:MAG: DUF4836 family protein, partial [Saprospiraceae bacterium]